MGYGFAAPIIRFANDSADIDDKNKSRRFIGIIMCFISYIYSGDDF